MMFRQILDPATSSLSYLLADDSSADAVVIDPLPATALLVRSILQEQGLNLRYALRTHVHAPDRIECGALCRLPGVCYAVGDFAAAPSAQRRLADGDVVPFGGERLRVMATPGHTPGCVSYLWRDRVFCGDVMEINGCGQAVDETDFGQMYDSVMHRIFALPDETLLFPAHDYRGRTVSTIAEERRMNSAFLGRSRDAFVTAMQAWPGNRLHAA